jgi:hypothetical protein
MGDLPLLFRRVHEYLILISGKFNLRAVNPPRIFLGYPSLFIVKD